MAQYPFHTDAYFPRNVWYIGAQSREVGERLLGRTIFDERILFYRTEAGAPVALSGLCPHRLLPLEHGKRIGDTVQCGYHGITFDASGACVHVPTQDEIPPRCRLKSYPVIERAGYVWIWTGAAELADPALMPDLPATGLEGDAWRATPNDTFHVNGRAQLIVDNLFDLSHVAYAHATGGEIIGGAAAASQAPDPAYVRPLNVAQRNGRLTAWRETPEDVLSPSMAALFPTASSRAASKIGTDLLSPALVNVWFDVSSMAQSPASARLNFVHGVTPETANSTHMYISTTRNYALEDAALDALFPHLNTGIASQDVAIYNAIEPHLHNKTTRDEVSFAADAGGIQARRVIEKMMAEELARAAPAP